MITGIITHDGQGGLVVKKKLQNGRREQASFSIMPTNLTPTRFGENSKLYTLIINNQQGLIRRDVAEYIGLRVDTNLLPRILDNGVWDRLHKKLVFGQVSTRKKLGLDLGRASGVSSRYGMLTLYDKPRVIRTAANIGGGLGDSREIGRNTLPDAFISRTNLTRLLRRYLFRLGGGVNMAGSLRDVNLYIEIRSNIAPTQIITIPNYIIRVSSIEEVMNFELHCFAEFIIKHISDTYLNGYDFYGDEHLNNDYSDVGNLLRELSRNQRGTISFMDVSTRGNGIIRGSKDFKDFARLMSGSIINRIKLTTFKSYLDLNNLVISSPPTNRDCFISAIALGYNNYLSSKLYKNTEVESGKAYRLTYKAFNAALNDSKIRTKEKKELTKEEYYNWFYNYGRSNRCKYKIRLNVLDANTMSWDVIDNLAARKVIKKVSKTHKINQFEAFNKAKDEGLLKEVNIVIYLGHAAALVDRPKDYVEKVWERMYGDAKLILPIKEPREERKRPIVGTYDIETVASKAIEPYAVGLFTEDDKNYCCFSGPKCLKAFFNYLYKKGRNLKLYAHNGGGFDAYILLRYIVNNERWHIDKYLDSRGSLINLKVKAWKVSKGKNRVIRKPIIISFLDSMKLLSGSLDSLTKEFKVPHPKLTGEVDHSLVTWEYFIRETKNKQLEEHFYYEYLRHDVLGLYEVLVGFKDSCVKSFGINPLNLLTISSLSRKVFLANYYNEIEYPLLTPPVAIDEILRQAYHGGRVEAFKLGLIKPEKGVYYYDVTSEYPFVMTKNLPYGEHKRYEYLKVKELLKLLSENKLSGVIQVTLKGGYKDNDDGLNIIPIKSGGRLIFPYFSKPTDVWLTVEEFEYTFKLKKNPYKFLLIHEAYLYETAPYYKYAIDKLAKGKRRAREKGNNSKALTFKKLINSAYGIWGLNYLDSRTNVEVVEEGDNRLTLNDYQSLGLVTSHVKHGNVTFVRCNHPIEASNVYSPIAISVTAQARIWLHTIMTDIQKAGGTIYYCDTDSVITNLRIEDNEELKNKYMANKGVELGELKNEFGEGVKKESIIILGPKVYCFKDCKPKFKGFSFRNTYEKKVINPNNRVISLEGCGKGNETLTYGDFRRLAVGYKLKHQQSRFKSKRRSIFKETLGVETDTITITNVFKNEEGWTYKKGRVDGNKVYPPYVGFTAIGEKVMKENLAAYEVETHKERKRKRKRVMEEEEEEEKEEEEEEKQEDSLVDRAWRSFRQSFPYDYGSLDSDPIGWASDDDEVGNVINGFKPFGTLSSSPTDYY